MKIIHELEYERNFGPTLETEEHRRLLGKKYSKAVLVNLAAREGVSVNEAILTKAMIVDRLLARVHAGRPHRGTNCRAELYDFLNGN